jgi:preprotein translocase subunit YajC
MLSTLLLLAEEQAKTPTGNAPSPLMDMLVMFLPIAVLFYFLMIRPKIQEDRARQALLNTVKKNDKVLTSGGIYGTVVAVSEKEDEITVKVDDNTRLRMIKAGIARNLTNEEAAREAKSASTATAPAGAVKTADKV